jgi:hypothetical protein
LRAELLLHCLEKRLEELLPYSKTIAWLISKIPGGAFYDDANQPQQQSPTTGSCCSTETAIRQLFLCFQMPLLNRQLAFVLLDIIVQRIFIDTRNKKRMNVH